MVSRKQPNLLVVKPPTIQITISSMIQRFFFWYATQCNDRFGSVIIGLSSRSDTRIHVERLDAMRNQYRRKNSTTDQ